MRVGPKGIEPKTSRGHAHAEAFCLMEYATEDWSTHEYIWNSRDGVTPFIVMSRTGQQMSHVNWAGDQYLPDHQPKSGDRVFVDFTPEMALAEAAKLIELRWSSGPYPMCDRYDSKEEAMELLVRDLLGDGKQSYLVTTP